MILYHNTSNENAIKINTEGIKGGMRLSAYGKGSEAEGAGVWCSTVRGYGYGGATITFEIDENDKDLVIQNDTEYIVYRDIKPEEITDIDLMISDIPCSNKRQNSINSTVESDIPNAIKQWGKDKLLNVFEKNQNHFVEPYNTEQLKHLIETGEKYCKGTILLTEGKKIEEDRSQEDRIKKQIQTARSIVRDESKYKKVEINISYAITKQDGTPMAVVEIGGVKYNFLPYNSRGSSKHFKYYDGNKAVPIGSLLGMIDRILDKQSNQPINKQQDIKPDKISKDYTDNMDDLEEIDNKEHKSFDIGEKEEKDESKLIESKILNEAGRNELLALAKGETITRYNKSAGYKGFSLVDIDTNSIMVHDSIVVTNKVGNYYDTIELEDILYWVGLYVEESKDKKMGIKIAEKALLGAADGMDIKIDCNCGDFVYRFAYQATILGYKYGKPENRPAKITNPNNYGSMCKHLIAMLSNKQWLKQVASTLNDWVIENVEWVRKFLGVTEEDFKVPDEVARELGRHGAYAKFIDKNIPQDEEQEDEQEEETQEDELEEIDDTEDNIDTNTEEELEEK